MRLPDFSAYHLPALERDEVRHRVIVNALASAAGAKSAEFSYWTLGGPGECAIKVGPHSIGLGALDKGQCRTLADTTVHTDYPGVVGPDLTAKWFTDRANELGLQFLEPEPQ